MVTVQTAEGILRAVLVSNIIEYETDHNSLCLVMSLRVLWVEWFIDFHCLVLFLSSSFWNNFIFSATDENQYVDQRFVDFGSPEVNVFKVSVRKWRSAFI